MINIIKYQATRDIPFIGIKKNDIIMIDRNAGNTDETVIYINSTYKSVPSGLINFEDPRYFTKNEIPEIKIGTSIFVRDFNKLVSYSKRHLSRVAVSDRQNISDSYKGTNAFATVEGIKNIGCDIFVWLRTNGGERFIVRMDEKFIFEEAVVYWFVNSEGDTCMTYKNKSPRADRFRMKCGNFYATKEEAAKYVTYVNQHGDKESEPVNFVEFRDPLNPFYNKI